MADSIKFKRGAKAKLPSLNYGEPAFVSDEKELYIGTKTGNVKLTSKSEIEELKQKNTELSSQLEQIEYKTKKYTFSTFSDAVLQNLNVGDTFTTHCFKKSFKNSGGTYIIVESEDVLCVPYSNGKFAQLQCNRSLYVSQLGIFPDNDITTKLQQLSTVSMWLPKEIIFDEGYYTISKPINITNRNNFRGSRPCNIAEADENLHGTVFVCSSIGDNAVITFNGFKHHVRDIYFISSTVNITDDRSLCGSKADIFSETSTTTSLVAITGIDNLGLEISGCYFKGFNVAVKLTTFGILKNCGFYSCQIPFQIRGNDCQVHDLRIFRCNYAIDLRNTILSEIYNIRADSVRYDGIITNHVTEAVSVFNVNMDYVQQSAIKAEACKYCTFDYITSRCGAAHANTSDDVAETNCFLAVIGETEGNVFNNIPAHKSDVTDNSLNYRCPKVPIYNSSNGYDNKFCVKGTVNTDHIWTIPNKSSQLQSVFYYNKGNIRGTVLDYLGQRYFFTGVGYSSCKASSVSSITI